MSAASSTPDDTAEPRPIIRVQRVAYDALNTSKVPRWVRRGLDLVFSTRNHRTQAIMALCLFLLPLSILGSNRLRSGVHVAVHGPASQKSVEGLMNRLPDISSAENSYKNITTGNAGKCWSLKHTLGQNVGYLHTCMGNSAELVSNVCLDCPKMAYQVKTVYKKMKAFRPSEGGPTCYEIYSSLASVNLVQLFYDVSIGQNSIWAEAGCSSCFRDDSFTDPNPKVVEFLKKYETAEECLKNNSAIATSSETCDNCEQVYEAVKSFYMNEFYIEGAKNICFDVESRMNILIDMWSNQLRCPLHFGRVVYQSVVYFLGTIGAMTLCMILGNFSSVLNRLIMNANWTHKKVCLENDQRARRAREESRLTAEQRAELAGAREQESAQLEQVKRLRRQNVLRPRSSGTGPDPSLAARRRAKLQSRLHTSYHQDDTQQAISKFIQENSFISAKDLLRHRESKPSVRAMPSSAINIATGRVHTPESSSADPTSSYEEEQISSEDTYDRFTSNSSDSSTVGEDSGSEKEEFREKEEASSKGEGSSTEKEELISEREESNTGKEEVNSEKEETNAEKEEVFDEKGEMGHEKEASIEKEGVSSENELNTENERESSVEKGSNAEQEELSTEKEELNTEKENLSSDKEQSNSDQEGSSSEKGEFNNEKKI